MQKNVEKCNVKSSMSYVALYRKFRPNDFNEVKGQENIVTALKNQIQTNRVGHAYLFSGTRGTGKTTIAKIMAKAVNCQNPIDGNPCNECSICKAINTQTSLNVVEIDAASNNGVDNIRQIVEEVQYSPTEGKYRVYIIDEVHMLSTGAFNALLKTLEEPPSYVMFILATTEAHKIPVTILSRCQRYEFKRMQVDTIVERLHELMAKEKIEADEEAVKYMAKCADGAMRDALSIMDQCISFYFDEKLTYQKVLDVLGAVDTEIFIDLYNYIVEEKVSDGIKMIDKLVLDGKDLAQFVINFTWFLRNVMLVKTANNTEDVIDMTKEKILELRKLSTKVDLEVLLRYIRIFSELSNQLKYATQKRVMLETAFIKLCKPAMDNDLEAIENRIELLEKKIEEGIVIKSDNIQNNITHENKAIENEKNEETSSVNIEEILQAMPEDIKEVAQKWNEVLQKTPMSVRVYLNGAIPTIQEDGMLTIVFNDEWSYDVMSSEMHKTELSNVILSLINKDVPIAMKYIDRNNREQNNNIMDITKLINAEVTFVD